MSLKLKIKLFIENYFWFIKESQSFMEGVYTKPVIFIISLFKGIRFSLDMIKSHKLSIFTQVEKEEK